MVNWLWLGKCHLALGHKQEAKPWLERVVGYSTTLEEEIEVTSYVAFIALHSFHLCTLLCTCIVAGYEPSLSIIIYGYKLSLLMKT